MSFSKKLLPVLLILANVLGNLSFAEAAALRSNQQGQNLLKYSEDFSHATWLKTNIGSTTGGQINPFGGTGAFLITDTNDASSLAHYVRQASTAVGARTWTASFYAKAGTKSFIWAYEPGTGTGVSFDVGTGTVGTPAAGTSASITAVGNGWYRCVLTFRTGIVAGSSIIIQLANSHIVGAYQGDGTGTVYLYGAQIVQDLKPGVYNRTIASTFTPSYVPTGAVRSSLQGQNIFSQSDSATIGNYPTNANVTAAAYAWPVEGLSNAITFGDNSVLRYAAKAPTLVAGAVYTLSFFVLMDDGAAPRTGAGGLNTDLFPLVGTAQTTGIVTRLISGNVYRIQYTFVAAGGATNVGVQKLSTPSSSTKGFKISGFQLVRGTAAGAYNRTLASALNTTFTPIGVTRSSLQGQNLLTYSEQFDNAIWTKSQSSVTANSVANPIDGALTADSLVEDGSNNYHYYTQSKTVAAGQPATFSVYAKAAGRNYLVIQMTGGVAATAWFDLTNGTYSNSGGSNVSATPVGGGWYRLSLTTVGVTSAVTYLSSTFTNNPTYQGSNGLVATYAYGAQLVKGTKPGAYNKTTASAFNASYQP